MWTNLGYWPGATDYPSAARELARRVGRAARLRPGDVVLDVACGFGDSLRLWIEEFGVSQVIGVEPDPDVTAEAQQRIEEWGLQDRISLRTERAERLELRELTPRVTAVVCVDAAYHFPMRAEWLLRLAHALPAGGRIGLAELAFSEYARTTARVRTMARLLGIPPSNLAADDLEAILEGSPASVIWSETAGEAVLDGFSRAHCGRGMAIAATRGMIKIARRSRLVDYRIVSAECQTAVPS